MKVILSVQILIAFCINLYAQNILGVAWGDTKQDVKQAISQKLVQEQDGSLSCETSMNFTSDEKIKSLIKVKTSIKFDFYYNKLYGIDFNFLNESTRFEDFMEILIVEFGEPKQIDENLFQWVENDTTILFSKIDLGKLSKYISLQYMDHVISQEALLNSVK